MAVRLPSRVRAVLFDIDGTLVDSNDRHVAAWEVAFREAGHDVPAAAIRGQIGKGSDNLVPALLPGISDDDAEALGKRHGEVFKSEHLPHVVPFAQAHALLARVRDDGSKVVLASSADGKEVAHYVGLLDAKSLVDATTSTDDAQNSKPDPDIFAIALKKVPPIPASEAIVIGDTPYDVEAAAKCGIATIAVLSGGFDEGALREAGAGAIYRDVADLLARYAESPLAP